MRLDAGADADAASARRRARRARARQVGARLDRAGQAVLIGFPDKESAHMADDKMLREMTCDPKFRKVLVTDGKTAVGQALVQGAGQGRRRPGLGRPRRAVEEVAGLRRITALPQVTLVPLDLTERPLGQRAGRRDRRQGGHRHQQRRSAPRARRRQRGAAPTWPAPRWTSTTSALLRLAQEFGPALRAAAPTA